MDSGSAPESEFLLPRKHAPLPKNVNRLKSVPAGSQISTGFVAAEGKSTVQISGYCSTAVRMYLRILLHVVVPVLYY
jgi:hypothetical protein